MMSKEAKKASKRKRTELFESLSAEDKQKCGGITTERGILLRLCVDQVKDCLLMQILKNFKLANEFVTMAMYFNWDGKM